MVKITTNFEDLRTYFTNMEHLLSIFKTYLKSNTLPNRVLFFHGMGGVGKSSLLRMFQLHCNNLSIPVGLALGSEAGSSIDILAKWSNDLSEKGTKLKSFDNSLKNYRSIQAKVEKQVQQAQDRRNNAIDKAAKTLTKKAAETAVSTIPYIGPAVSVLGGIGADSFIDWLRGFLSKPEIELIIDPTKELTNQFLAAVQHLGSQSRLTLMLDGIEHLTGSEKWVMELARNMHPNILLVIAGRTFPKWSTHWPAFLKHTKDCKVEPMAASDMRTLAQRYYSYIHGGDPNSEQVEQIINFARGLPIVVNSAVELWVKYGIEDFAAIKPEVVADLADRLREGVPKEIYPLVQSAAAVRWFNKDILKALVEVECLDFHYEALRGFPFVYPRREGFALHDQVREVLEESLSITSPEVYRSLHNKAADYFEQLARYPETHPRSVMEAQPLSTEKCTIEVIYHKWQINTELGFSLLREEIVKAFTLSNIEFCELLLAEALRHQLNNEQRNWLTYWKGELAYRRGLWFDALLDLERLTTIIQLQDSSILIPTYLTLGKIRYQQGELEISKHMFESCLALIQRVKGEYNEESFTFKQAIVLEYLAKVCRMEGDFDSAIKFHGDALKLSNQLNDSYQICSNLGGYGTTLLLAGRLIEGVTYLSSSINLANKQGFSQFVSTGLRSRAAGLLLLGRLEEAERDSIRSWEIAEKLGDIYNIGFSKLMLAQIFLERCDYSRCHSTLIESVKHLEQVGARFDLSNAWQCFSDYYKKIGDLPQALSALDRAEELLSPLHFKYGISWLYYRRGELLAATDYLSSKSEFAKSIQLTYAMGSTYIKAKALFAMANLEFQYGNITLSQTFMEESFNVSQENQFLDLLASIHLLKGRMNFMQGNMAPAFDCFLQALFNAVNYNIYLFNVVLGEVNQICTASGLAMQPEIRKHILYLIEKLEQITLSEGLPLHQGIGERGLETSKNLTKIRALLP